MKLNKKGFMLAEVVVSASVVAVVLVTMYIGINRMTNAYNKRNKYYDLDAQQVAMEVNDALVRNMNFDSLFDIVGGNYILLSEENEEFKNDVPMLCALYKEKLEINADNVYIVRNNSAGLTQLKDSNINQKFKDYLDYFINKTDFNENYSYFIVVELKKNNDYYYYTLKVK